MIFFFFIKPCILSISDNLVEFVSLIHQVQHQFPIGGHIGPFNIVIAKHLIEHKQGRMYGGLGEVLQGLWRGGDGRDLTLAC